MNGASSRAATLLRLVMATSLGLVVLVEIVIGRTELAGHLVPQSNIGTLLETEEQIIRPNPHPAIIIFGTSRGRGAFLPTVMESRLGLDRGAVLNLAMGGTNIHDALVTYTRSRDQLRSAAIVIVQVDPFQFSPGRPPSPRLRRYGTLRERSAYRTTPFRWGVYRDYLFRSAVALEPMGFYARRVLVEGRPPPRDSVDMFGRLAVSRIASDHDPREFRESRHRYWIDWQYSSYAHSTELEDMLVRLIGMVHEDGGKVYLVGMPTVAKYRQLLSQLPVDPQNVLESRIQDHLGTAADAAVLWNRPEDAGLDTLHFRDWGHLNTAGAIIWSDFYARWLLQNDQHLIATLRTARVPRRSATATTLTPWAQ